MIFAKSENAHTSVFNISCQNIALVYKNANTKKKKIVFK